MIPYKTLLTYDKSSARSVYLQVCSQLIQLIKSGIIPIETRLPGTRAMGSILNLHRKTIVAIYDELLSQGWIETIPSKGTFVHKNLPVVDVKKLHKDKMLVNKKPEHAGFEFYKNPIWHRPDPLTDSTFITVDDGIPDTRLTPTLEIARAYRSIINRAYNKKYLSYSSIYGSLKLREVLVKYLNETRGLNIAVENILITRGSQMGIYLSAALLFKKPGVIIVGETNYQAADFTFHYCGAKIQRVAVDHEGIDTNRIEEICKKKRIKAVYVTPHHHHPTTVTMTAKRRVHLLKLAEKYRFAILEDDYDYDFHYANSPILPLASHDADGMVVYMGALCKTIAPAMRIGYLVASHNFIEEAAQLRRYIDRQGDTILELTIAELIANGDVYRHTKKALRIYHERRDTFIKLLKEKANGYLNFNIPEGGMAVWALLKHPLEWEVVQKRAIEKKLALSHWKKYDSAKIGHNGIRLGFASLNQDEAQIAIDRLRMVLDELAEI